MLWRSPFIGKALQQTPRFVTNSNSKSYPKSSAQNSNLKIDMGAQTILESGMGTHVGAQKRAEWFFPLCTSKFECLFQPTLIQIFPKHPMQPEIQI